MKYAIELIHTYPTEGNPQGNAVREKWTVLDDGSPSTIERVRERIAKLNQVVKVLSVKPVEQD